MYNITQTGGGISLTIPVIINIIFFIISFIMAIVYVDYTHGPYLIFSGLLYFAFWGFSISSLAKENNNLSLQMISLFFGFVSYALLTASLLYNRKKKEDEKTKTGRIVASVFAGLSFLTTLPILFIEHKNDPKPPKIQSAPLPPPPQTGGGYVSSIYLSSSTDF